MKRQIFIALLLLLLIPQFITAKERGKINLYFEFDQLTQLRFGLTYNFTDDWGIRSSFGLSPLGPTTMSYNLMGVYRFLKPANPWQIDMEFGLPLSYINFIEDRWVDWDSNIDDPFEGWLAGVSARMGRRFSTGFWGARLGAAYWWEHQRDSGWKGFRLMPIVSAIYEM